MHRLDDLLDMFASRLLGMSLDVPSVVCGVVSIVVDLSEGVDHAPSSTIALFELGSLRLAPFTSSLALRVRDRGTFDPMAIGRGAALDLPSRTPRF